MRPIAGMLLVLLMVLPFASPAKAAAPIYLGVWQPGSPMSMTNLTAFEQNAKKHVAIVHWYQGWGAANAAFNAQLLTNVADHGSLPMITWEPWDYKKGVNQPAYALRNIVAGNYDGYIRSWAVGMKGYGKPALLRWAHEMNTATYPWGRGVNGNTDAEYIAAFRRIVDIFRAEGAANVQFIWAPNIAWDSGSAFESLYPGETYVDWLGLDGFNKQEWGGWQSFGQIFRPSYDRLIALPQATPKPIIISEFASDEYRSNTNKASWITDAFATLRTWDRLKAVVWFNEKVTAADWRIESSKASLAAFQQAVAHPDFAGTWP